jgi:hypothetical protein
VVATATTPAVTGIIQAIITTLPIVMSIMGFPTDITIITVATTRDTITLTQADITVITNKGRIRFSEQRAQKFYPAPLYSPGR